jgi:hypothetical protein
MTGLRPDELANTASRPENPSYLSTEPVKEKKRF